LELAGSGFGGRPIQGLYLALLFELFGVSPFGYHLVNTVVLAVAAALFYLLLIGLRIGRGQSFATTILFVMLPQLTTVRVWYAAFQIPLSLLFALASMNCQLIFERSGRARWLAAAIISAIFSIGAYEIFAPLIVGLPAALAIIKWRTEPAGSSPSMRRSALVGAAIVCVALVGLGYKLTFSGRTGPIADPHRYILGLYQLIRLDYDWRTESGLNLFAMVRTHFIAPVQGFWVGAKSLASGAAGNEVRSIAIVVAAVTWWRTDSADRSLLPTTSIRLLIWGIAAFLLGHATFLIVPSIVFTSTGMDNRVQIAAATGVAMVFAALAYMTTGAFPKRQRRRVYATVIAVIAAGAFARLSAIEQYWADTPAIQKRILDVAAVDLRSVPANSRIVLDGICPYHGPAVVFEAWDIGGAFSLALGRPVEGEAVSPRMALTAKGVATSIYKQPSFYPYGNRLFIYNPSTHLLLRLDDQEVAERYFRQRQPTSCPGFVARGAEV
jgi:nitrate reductase gamma subunit